MGHAHPITQHLQGVSDVLVLLAPGVDATALATWDLPQSAEVRELIAPVKRPRDRDAVILAARDLVDLRKAVSALASLGASTRVGIWLEHQVKTLPAVVPRPEWPDIDTLVACRRGHSHMLVTFASPVTARSVLLQAARAAAANQAPRTAWPMLGVRRDDPWLWPTADPGATVAMSGRLFDSSVDSPPDLVLTPADETNPPDFGQEAHPVLGRVPTTSVTDPLLTWRDLDELPEASVDAELARRGAPSLGAVDERVINPIGFDRAPTGPAVALESGPGDTLVAQPAGEASAIVLDGGRGLSETDVAPLRRLPGLELTWQGGPGPQHYCRLVVSLAMAGVPLLSPEVPRWAELLLPGDIVDLLGQAADLTDRLTREEHSIRLRRAALRTCTSDAWRRTVAGEHGLQMSPPPRVSVLLVTRRPEMLPFALRQLARQRDVDFEVVLATHGFEADPSLVTSFSRACPAPLTTFPVDQATLFGEVMNLAAQRATGDVVLKVDDDDWYSPDFIADLVRARGYSGADVVGCPPEFTFVEPLWLTTRRPDDTEVFRPFVAGGTMLVDRSTLSALGGFRHTRKYVDANLLSAVTNAGGSVYRTHGLGYVLRRGAQGHTWDPGLGYFVTQRRAPEQWRGFRPSALLEAASVDLPAKPEDERVSP